MSTGLIYNLYNDKRTVFTLQEIAMLLNESDNQKLKQRLNYYVRTRKLKNPRRGIYTKENYSVEELACKVFKPSYISLEYVLQKAGVVFQYDTKITNISYLSRTLSIDNTSYVYRKIKNEILYHSTGIITNDNGISIATPERAFLDTLYLNREYFFDTTENLDRERILSILPIFQSGQLTKRVQKVLNND
ncbi:MAG: hypothetical protein ACOC11_01880 [Prolixibacteraceae bacterium]